MRDRLTRRLSSVGVAFGLALGGSAIALAAGAPSLPDEAADEAREAVAAVEQQEEPEDRGGDGVETGEVGAENEGDGENAEAFSAWVESLPEDWGCVRGFLVSQAARGDHRGDDFVGPEYGSAAEAASDLGFEGRCVEVAIGGPDVEGADAGDGGRPEHAGPPSHAGSPAAAGTSSERGGRPDHAGPKEGSGPPAHAGQARGGD